MHFPSTALSPSRIKHLEDPVCRAEIKHGKSLIMVNINDLLAEVQDPLTEDYNDLYIYTIHRREASEDENETKSYEWKRIQGTYRNEANANAAAEQELYASEIAVLYPGMSNARANVTPTVAKGAEVLVHPSRT